MHGFDYFDEIWCINLASEPEPWARMQARFTAIGILPRVRRFAARPTPANRAIGRALSHRHLVQNAAERGLRNVLVFEDTTLLHAEAADRLAAASRDLARIAWPLCLLGAPPSSVRAAALPDSAHLLHAAGRGFPDAVAYGEPGFAALLAALPAGFTAMAASVAAGGGLVPVQAALPGTVMLRHPAATIPPDLPFQPPADQRGFVA